MSAVGVVEVEDRFDRFRGAGDEPVVGDVDGASGVGGEDVDAFASKGSITASAYLSSAASATSIAASMLANRTSRMFVRLASSGLPFSSRTVHDSMPDSRYSSVSRAWTSPTDMPGSLVLAWMIVLRAARLDVKSSRSRRVTVSPDGWRAPSGGQMQGMATIRNPPRPARPRSACWR